MSYVIHLKRPGKPDAWHTGHRETESVREAKVFATKGQAEAHRALAGMYRKHGWTATVQPVPKVRRGK